MKNQIDRREFLRFSALASASVLVPGFLHSYASSAPGTTNGKILVLIQLAGGNDGLNCVVPYRNDLYYKARPALGMKKDELLFLTDEAGLHPALSHLADLYHDGKLGVLSSVGYPNPNRSHFRSTDIWQSASDENQIVNTGWVGRYLDAQCSPECRHPHAAVEIDDTLSLVMKGEQRKGLAFRNPALLQNYTRQPLLHALAQEPTASGNDAAEFLRKTLVETSTSADYLYQHSRIFASKRTYPQHDFGKRMKTVAELICSGSDTSVYYISLPGFDTHAFQRGAHNRVLEVYAESLAAFIGDLKESKRFDDTLIVTFSEFGRRVEQNASKGTDHGTANTVFIAGGRLSRAGLLNPLPDLEHLVDGDLVHSIDFRQVYATMLDKFLLSDSKAILGRAFQPLDFVG